MNLAIEYPNATAVSTPNVDTTRRAGGSKRRRPVRTILEAAQTLFERDGYAATTMAAIAREAGVALKTVYLAFETKSGVLRAVWDTLLRGAPDIPVADQPWYREVIDEPDPARQLALNARNARDVKRRIGGVLRVIRDAAPVDRDVHDVWTLIQTDFYENQRRDRASAATTQGAASRARRDSGHRHPLDAQPSRRVAPPRGRTRVDARQWERWFADTSAAQLLK